MAETVDAPSCSVTISDIRRAFDAIGRFDDTADVQDVETESQMTTCDDIIHDVTRGFDASSCRVEISDIRHALNSIDWFD